MTSRLLAILLLLLAAPAWAESPSASDAPQSTAVEDPAGAILEKVSAAYRDAQTVHVELQQTSSGPSYFEPLVQTGSFVVQRPDRIRWELSGAGGTTTWLSDGETLWIVQPADKTVQVFKHVSTGIRRYIGFLTGLQNIHADYTVTLVSGGPDAVEGRTVLRLQPLDRDEQLKVILVQLDAAYRVVGVVLHTPFGDRTDMQLSELRFEGPVGADTFRWATKKGWHLVPMD